MLADRSEIFGQRLRSRCLALTDLGPTASICRELHCQLVYSKCQWSGRPPLQKKQLEPCLPGKHTTSGKILFHHGYGWEARYRRCRIECAEYIRQSWQSRVKDKKGSETTCIVCRWRVAIVHPEVATPYPIVCIPR